MHSSHHIADKTGWLSLQNFWIVLPAGSQTQGLNVKVRFEI